VGCCLLVDRVWCDVLCRTSRWIPVALVKAGNSSRRLSGGVSALMTFTLGTDGGTMWPGVEREVNQWRRRLFLQ
jgi:hypothetical protein